MNFIKHKSPSRNPSAIDFLLVKYSRQTACLSWPEKGKFASIISPPKSCGCDVKTSPGRRLLQEHVTTLCRRTKSIMWASATPARTDPHCQAPSLLTSRSQKKSHCLHFPRKVNFQPVFLSSYPTSHKSSVPAIASEPSKQLHHREAAKTWRLRQYKPTCQSILVSPGLTLMFKSIKKANLLPKKQPCNRNVNDRHNLPCYKRLSAGAVQRSEMLHQWQWYQLNWCSLTIWVTFVTFTLTMNITLCSCGFSPLPAATLKRSTDRPSFSHSFLPDTIFPLYNGQNWACFHAGNKPINSSTNFNAVNETTKSLLFRCLRATRKIKRVEVGTPALGNSITLCLSHEHFSFQPRKSPVPCRAIERSCCSTKPRARQAEALQNCTWKPGEMLLQPRSFSHLKSWSDNREIQSLKNKSAAEHSVFWLSP